MATAASARCRFLPEGAAARIGSGSVAVLLLALATSLSACSASRPEAGRVLLRVAEVVVGAELVDRSPGTLRSAGVAGQALPESDRPVRVAAPAVRAPKPPAIATPATRPAAVAGARPARPAPVPVVSSASVTAHPGRWILIRKAARTLAVFDGDRSIKTYPIVLGADPVDAKLYEGDRKTPEGEYHIVGKHVHPEWQRFMLLDYPNADDRLVYAWKRAKGLVPGRGRQVPGTGGAVGIHGTPSDALNRGGVNWTYGCISLLSRDIEELYRMIPVGTLVVIEH
jgi:lipoprotein-anchoring transpeptidase ErfK/SrfK